MGESPVGSVCWECGSPFVPETPDDVFCHRCNVDLEIWVDEMTDDKPYND